MARCLVLISMTQSNNQEIRLDTVERQMNQKCGTKLPNRKNYWCGTCDDCLVYMYDVNRFHDRMDEEEKDPVSVFCDGCGMGVNRTTSHSPKKPASSANLSERTLTLLEAELSSLEAKRVTNCSLSLTECLKLHNDIRDLTVNIKELKKQCEKDKKIEYLVKVINEQNNLFEKLDEAMATPERIKENKEMVGRFISSLDITETAAEIVNRVCTRLLLSERIVSNDSDTPFPG